MARPKSPERNAVARSFGQLRRFLHLINSDKVFGTHRFENQLIASKRFAAANAWRCGKHFSLDLLIRNKANCGRRDLDKYGYHLNACDHPEYFRVAGKPIAIVAHNYELDVDGLRRLVSDLNGALVLHEPPVGKAASWYFPGHALPMCLTRANITEIVWPTDEEMAATAAGYAFA